MDIEPYAGHTMYCAFSRDKPLLWSIAPTREEVARLLNRERYTVRGQPRVAGLDLSIRQLVGATPQEVDTSWKWVE